jgi:hypothetical protein
MRAYQSDDLQESPEDETNGEKDCHDEQRVCVDLGWLGGSQVLKSGACSCGSRGVLRFPKRVAQADAARKRDRDSSVQDDEQIGLFWDGRSQVWPEASGQEQDKKWRLKTRFGGVLAAGNRSTKVGWQGDQTRVEG